MNLLNRSKFPVLTGIVKKLEVFIGKLKNSYKNARDMIKLKIGDKIFIRENSVRVPGLIASKDPRSYFLKADVGLLEGIFKQLSLDENIYFKNIKRRYYWSIYRYECTEKSCSSRK